MLRPINGRCPVRPLGPEALSDGAAENAGPASSRPSTSESAPAAWL
jgi:hypothetical protein